MTETTASPAASSEPERGRPLTFIQSPHRPLATAIRVELARRDMTRKDLANDKASVQSVSRYLNGERSPSVEWLNTVFEKVGGLEVCHELRSFFEREKADWTKLDRVLGPWMHEPAALAAFVLACNTDLPNGGNWAVAEVAGWGEKTDWSLGGKWSTDATQALQADSLFDVYGLPEVFGVGTP